MQKEQNCYEKHAICIQCHNKPELINSLIKLLPKENFDFYIHVDEKSDIYYDIVREENIFFSERIDVCWGCSSQIKATLILFDIIPTGKYKYIHLISGNDFIIKSVEEFLEFFSGKDTEYIESNIINGNSSLNWESRYKVWYPGFLIKRPTYKLTRLLRFIYRVFVMRTGILKKRNLPVREFYGGSSWFSITDDMLTWMKMYLSEHNDYLEFFEHSLCCDEVFFSTLVRQSPYVDRIANDALRYLIWQGSNTGGPKELQKEDVGAMVVSPKLFARKITDISVVEEIIKEINFKEKSGDGVL